MTAIPGPPESWGPAVVLGPPDAETWRSSRESRPARSTSPSSPPDPEAVDCLPRRRPRQRGRDNGPRACASATTHYYAAFVIRPDGHNVERLFQGP